MTTALLLISTLLSLAVSEASLKPTSPVVGDPEETHQQRGQRESGYGYAGGSLNYYNSGYPQQQWNSGYNSYNRYPNNYYQYQYQVPGYQQQQYYQGRQAGWYPSSYYRGGGFGYNNNIQPYNNAGGGYYSNNNNNNFGFGGRYNSQAYGSPIRQGYY